MKRRLLSLMLALLLVALILPVGTASAAPKAYGNVYALNQPLIFDWSAYAGYGTTCNFYLLNLKTQEVDLSHEEIPYMWSTFTSDVKGSYMVYVEFLDTSGKKTKEIADFFHIGAVVAAPDYIPEENIRMRGILAKDAKKYPAFTETYYEAVEPIVSYNPYFEDSNNDEDSALWLNKSMNSNFAYDLYNVIRKGYASSKYSYNSKLEADLFDLVNLYRVLNEKTALVWNDRLGTFARLRVTAACDNPYKADTYDLSEVGGFGTDLTMDFLRYGLAVPGYGREFFLYEPRKLDWQSNNTAYEIFDTWLADDDLRADMLGEFKYGAVAVVKCSRLLGKKQTGIAMMVEFEN